MLAAAFLKVDLGLDRLSCDFIDKMTLMRKLENVNERSQTHFQNIQNQQNEMVEYM